MTLDGICRKCGRTIEFASDGNDLISIQVMLWKFDYWLHSLGICRHCMPGELHMRLLKLERK
jgi:hypothetical protein